MEVGQEEEEPTEADLGRHQHHPMFGTDSMQGTPTTCLPLTPGVTCLAGVMAGVSHLARIPICHLSQLLERQIPTQVEF